MPVTANERVMSRNGTQPQSQRRSRWKSKIWKICLSVRPVIGELLFPLTLEHIGRPLRVSANRRDATRRESYEIQSNQCVSREFCTVQCTVLHCVQYSLRALRLTDFMYAVHQITKQTHALHTLCGDSEQRESKSKGKPLRKHMRFRFGRPDWRAAGEQMGRNATQSNNYRTTC